MAYRSRHYSKADLIIPSTAVASYNLLHLVCDYAYVYTSLCVHKSSLADVSMHSMHSPCIKLMLGLSFSHILLGYTLLNLVLEYTLLNLVCDYAYVYTSLRGGSATKGH